MPPDIAREVQITFDCADPGALAAFWAEALGYQVQPPPPGFDSWEQALDAWGVPPGTPQRRLGRGRPQGHRPAPVLPAHPGG
ncbi:VOC family protein [Actinoplanes palleronii]|uniref:Glyoxalase-like domain-containing protein n=1 Tax=Actinoplanes palleronii TaxID=113570 RepID=A0ABQ4BI36_9ACTN|nr:VOC family protein [Actinoplanes palleronii]GIE70322.1 hypothetical protein Apa02nite_064300 [Actinoplanes palleronii]